MAGIAILDGLGSLAARYDVWLVDVWGVIHNGVAVFPRAGAALQSFRQIGGTVVLVTNAPRPNGEIVTQLRGLGLDAGAYDRIVTSGDVCHDLIARYRGRPVHALGPERDLPIYHGTGVRLVPAAAAEVVVCTGLFDDTTETPDDYRARLAALNDRRVPMICANPDIVVERGGDVVYCAGALAEVYAAIGGAVVYAGKPHRPIYEAAVAAAAAARGATVTTTRVLAIGDGIRTDIAGAAGFGIDAVFVPSAVHVRGGFDPVVVAELFRDTGFAPVAAVPRLAW